MALPDWRPAFSETYQHILQLKEDPNSHANIERLLNDPKYLETITACWDLLEPYIRDYKNFSQLFKNFTQYLERVNEENPLNHIEKYAPRPLLLIAGTHDLPNVLNFNEKLYEFLKPFYENNDHNLQLLINDSTHELTQEACNQAITFLKEQR